MEYMAIIFGVAFFLFSIAAIAGLIKPSIVKQESRGKAFGVNAVSALISLVLLGVVVPDEKEETLVGEAHNYDIVKVEDYSFRGRDRIRWIITSSNAKTINDRALTAIRAAKDLMELESPDQANIWIEMDGELTGRGYLFSIVTFTPDGRGNSGNEKNGDVWEVESSKTQISEQQIRVARAWSQNRERFLDTDDLVNEEELKKYISETLSIPKDDVSLPFISREKVPYQ